MKKAIRNEYADKGVEAFYQLQGDMYENPHFQYIKTLLRQNSHRINYTKVFDFCCGGGEVTQALSDCNIPQKDFAKRTFLGCDPFTSELYKKNTAQDCLTLSFDDVIKGKLFEAISDEFFTAIICSFAMHLCPEKKLYPLVQQLFRHSSNIVIITPHKRPQLEDLTGIELLFEDFTLTDRSKKVFLKSYIPSVRTLQRSPM